MQNDSRQAKPYSMMAADVYDAIYSNKDYASEAKELKKLIEKHCKSDGHKLLDVGCGTGMHLVHLTKDFDITGIDLSEEQLEAARKRLPGLEFIQADMRDFDLGRKFDVIACLFSSIGYVYPYEDMKQSIKTMARHLRPSGILIVEPWLQPDVYDPNRPPTTDTGELPAKNLKVTRTAHNSIDGNVSVLKMHHVVTTPKGKQEFSEEHRLGMYTHEEFEQAFENAGLSFIHSEKGLSGRGIYIGLN